MVMTGFALTYAGWGFSLPAWHATQLVLHFLCACCAYWFTWLLTKKRGISLIATVFFLIHPINSQAVNYLSSRSEIQASLFYLLSLCCYIHSRESSDKWQRAFFALSIFAAIIALLSKTIAVTIPFTAFLWELLFRARKLSQYQAVRKSLARVAPLLATVIVYLIFRQLLFGFVFGPPPGAASTFGLRIFEDHELAEARASMGARSIITNIQVQATALWKYLFLFFWPPAQSIVHDVSLFPDLLAWPTCASVPASLALVGCLVWLARYNTVASFSGLFFLSVIAPTSIISLNIVMNEHRLYMASIGFFLFFCSILETTPLILQRPKLSRRVVIGLLLLTALLCHHRNAAWRSSVALWADAVAKAPQARYARLSYGNALVEEGFPEAGVWQLERYSMLYPVDAIHRTFAIRMAYDHIKLKNIRRAHAYLKIVEGRSPNPLITEPLHAAWLEATRQIHPALQRCYEMRKNHDTKTLIDDNIKNLEASIADLERRLLQVTEHGPSPSTLEAQLNDRLGRPNVALHIIDQIEAPLPAETLALRGWILFRGNRFKAAARSLEQALQLNPSDGETWNRLIAALAFTKQKKAAILEARKLLEQGLELSFDTRWACGLPPYGPPPSNWIEEDEHERF